MKKIFFNRCFDKSRLKYLISWSLMVFGEKKTIKLVEELKDIGFQYATQAGISLSIDDLKIPPTKSLLLSEAEIEISFTEYEYLSGNLTAVERFQKMIDIWHRTSENLKQNVVQYFRSTDLLNPVYMMAFSGARGNISQVRQLVGMRGLMADPQGQIIDFPIRSNFREGLTLTEYIISCYGARKGLVDTALRTANSGYLTRRLVDVAQHILICQLDCGTKRGIYLKTMKEGNKILLSLENRLIGRILAETIQINGNGSSEGSNLSSIEKIYKNQDISPYLSAKISSVKKEVFVRSPLTCEAKNSICQLCYGWSLAHGSLVSLGEAVGILAAQSIGEPGTQLTMRTFHTGGVFSGDMMDEIRAPFNGLVEFTDPFQGLLIRTSHGKVAFLTKNSGEFLLKSSDEIIKKFFVPVSSILFVRHGEKVVNRQLLAEYSSISTQKNQRIQSKHDLNSKIEGQIYFENVVLSVKTAKEGNLIKTAKNLGSVWILSGKIYQSLIVSNFFPEIGDLVSKKSIMDQFLLISPINGILESNKKLIQNSSSSDFTKQNYSKNENFIAFENKSFFLKKSFFNFLLKKINYKKFGYFLSNFSNKKIDKFFFCNSLFRKPKYQGNTNKQSTFQSKIGSNLLKNHSSAFNEMSSFKIHWFSKNYKTKSGGFCVIDSYYINDDINLGQIFWIPEQNYQSKNFIISHSNSLTSEKLNLKIKLKRFHNLSKYEGFQEKIYKHQVIKVNKKLNFQLKKIKKQKKGSSFLLLDSNLSSIESFSPFLKHFKTQNVVARTLRSFSIEKNFKYQKSNLLKLKNLRWIQKNNSLVSILTNEGKKNRFYFSFDGLIQIKNFNVLKTINSNNFSFKYHSSKFFRNTLSTSRLQIYSYRLTHICFLLDKKIFFKSLKKNNVCFSSKFKIKSGWIYLPKNQNSNFKNNKLIIFPGKILIDDIFFDQSFVFIEYFPCFSNFFNKRKIILNLKKTYNNWILVSICNLEKNFKNIKFKIFLPKSNKKKVYTVFYFVYKKNKKNKWNFNKLNFYYQKFFLLIRKISEYSLVNSKHSKKQFYIKNTKNISFLSTKKIFWNQQTISPLYSKNLPADFKIQNFLSVKNLKNNFSVKKIHIFQNIISLQISKDLYIKKPRLKLSSITLQNNLFLKQKVFNIAIEFALLRQIQITDYMNFDLKKSTTKILTHEKNIVVKNKSILFTSFFSPYDGEIIKNQLDPLGKKNFLILTNTDQKSFYRKRKIIKNYVGQFIRANDELGTNVCLNQSGQIIEIDLDKIVLRKGQPILFSSRGVFHIQNNDLIKKGSPLITLFYQRLKTGDIVQGIPKIEEFFEARQTKEGEILPENLHDKLLNLFQDYKQKFNSQEAARKSIEKIQQILVEGVLRVYQSQGVSIADKHLEIIVRQMTSKVKIIDGGQTGLLRGELIDLQWIEIVNQGIETQKAEYEPIVLGITKASLETESFISAASFQETTRILSRAAIERKTDFLRGLKENVILGHLIPAGTGFSLSFDPENIKYFKKSSIEKSFSDIFY